MSRSPMIRDIPKYQWGRFMTGLAATNRLTWDDIIRLDPRIAALERDALVIRGLARRKGSFCANAAFYGRIKPALSVLVGWGRLPEGYTPPKRMDRPIQFVTMSELVDETNADRKTLSAFLATLTPEQREAHAKLTTSEAYDVVYERLYDLMPNCRRCSCL